MENASGLDTVANESTLLLLPIGAVAFAPFLLLLLVAAIVSNAILLALVVLACAKKLNNNINIYLFSLAIGGLIGAFNIFCLLSIVVARRWVLGVIMCNISYCVVIVYFFLFIIFYLVISRDKLKGVKNPFQGRPTNKRAYVNSVIVWVVSIGAGIFFLTFAFRVINHIPWPDLFIDRGHFICFGLTSRRVNRSTTFIVLSLFVIGYWIVSFTIIIVTSSNFVRILIELQKLKKLRLRFAKESRTSKVIRINGRDKPLFHTGEERTAKSLTLVYFIQLGCVLISSGMLYIQIIRNFALPMKNIDGPDFQIYFVILLIVQHYPCVNPIFLILSNKRLRIRVKELFKCTLNPEVQASPIHQLTNKPTKAASVLFAQKMNKITPLTEVGNESKKA